MQAEAAVEAGAFTSAQHEPAWQAIDRALRGIARRHAALDAEEARWLREAEAHEVWRPLGMVSALDYLERVLGYGPRAAQERLRVARSLGALPELTAALASGELPYTAVRELTRVATPATEASWRAAAAGKTVRQIEELVADHRPGDNPDDPADPEARPRVVRLELSPETFAVLRQAHQVLDDEHGRRLSDDELVASLCGALLEGAAPDADGRAKFQIAVTLCARCKQGWQDGAGAKLAIGAAAVERAECDAQHIGSLDGPAPARAYQDVSPSVARFVHRRDGGRCRVPGCRSSRGLELHHIIHRADGGSHDATNLCQLCTSCHIAHHEGRLTITGTANELAISRPQRTVADPDAHVGAVPSASALAAIRQTEADPDAHMGAAPSGSALEAAIRTTEAKAALVGSGWKPAVARAAVAEAVAALGPTAPLDRLVCDALRRCGALAGRGGVSVHAPAARGGQPPGP